MITAKALPDADSERAYSVELFDAARLANAPGPQLEEILQQVPGLQLFRRSDARSGHPTSQGVTLRALGGNASSRALLVLDGVPQTDPFGGWVNWPAYDPASLAEVRVIRGGGSVAYGPGALAGTIAMTSAVAPAVEAEVLAGSRESLEARAFLGTEVGPGKLAVSGRAARSDGFVPVTEETRGPADRAAPFRAASLRALWTASLSGSVELQASGLLFSDRRDRGVDFTGNRTSGADGSLRLAGSGRWPWSATAYVQARDFRSSFASVADGRLSASRVALQDEVPSHAVGGLFELRPRLGAGLELRVGGDLRATEGETRELFFFVEGEPTRRRRAGGQSLTAGLFTELTARTGPVALSGGARIDHWRISDGRLREHVIATEAVLRDDRYAGRSGWLPTARASLSVDAGSGVALRSAAYLGWRLPTLNELFRPFRAGADATAANALLDPERLAGIEAGADYRSGGLRLSLTGFANRLSNAIANVTLGVGPGVFPGVGFVGAGGQYRQRRNLDSIRVRGVEFSSEYRRGAFSARGGMSLVNAEVSSDGPAAPLNGSRPAQTPRLTLTGGVEWAKDDRAFSLQVCHVGAQYEDDLNDARLPAATVVGAFAAWPLGRDLQIVASAENLFNERVVAGIGDDGSIERATPRTLWLGLRFRRRAER